MDTTPLSTRWLDTTFGYQWCFLFSHNEKCKTKATQNDTKNNIHSKNQHKKNKEKNVKNVCVCV